MEEEESEDVEAVGDEQGHLDAFDASRLAHRVVERVTDCTRARRVISVNRVSPLAPAPAMRSAYVLTENAVMPNSSTRSVRMRILRHTLTPVASPRDISTISSFGRVSGSSALVTASSAVLTPPHPLRGGQELRQYSLQRQQRHAVVIHRSHQHRRGGILLNTHELHPSVRNTAPEFVHICGHNHDSSSNDG